MGAREDQISAAINDAVRLMRAHKLAAIDFAAHVVDAVRDDLPDVNTDEVHRICAARIAAGLEKASKRGGTGKRK